MNAEAKNIITALDLKPHPEGGYYRETYRASREVALKKGAENKKRSAGTAIYYLLERGAFSCFHKIVADEMIHFYDGQPVSIWILDPKGNLREQILGPHLAEGETFQVLITGGSWFALEMKREGPYSLLGCTVSPGFDFEDFEMAKKQQLLSDFPEHKDVIERLTKE